nr:hypothetical protein [Rhodospirillales bacterium]
MKQIRIFGLLMISGFMGASGVAFAQDSDAVCANLDDQTLTLDLPCVVSGDKTYSATLIKDHRPGGEVRTWHVDKNSIAEAHFAPDNKACAVLDGSTNDLKLKCVTSHGKVWQAQLSAKYPGSERLIWGLETYWPATPGGEEQNWLSMSDQEFAENFSYMAFSDSLVDREIVAWLLFARINQQVEYEHGTTSVWKAWATDKDTFTESPSFVFNQVPRVDPHFVTQKAELAGGVNTMDPDGSNEEVTRNDVGYNYIIETSKMNTYEGVVAYVGEGNEVNMPVGSIEIKASWLLSTKEKPAPADALTFKFTSGTYWFRGIHIMAKMRPAPQDLYYSEAPSWFWTTFEYNRNPGVQNIRDNFITQRGGLDIDAIRKLLTMGGIDGIGFEAYAPNGTQIRYTANGDGSTPVILGHTNMEDFAGSPGPWDDGKGPSAAEENIPLTPAKQWTGFNASCHSCHATASFNPNTGEYFPFNVPVGALPPDYTYTNPKGVNFMLGDGYVPLDFMWPIAFQAPKPKPSK